MRCWRFVRGLKGVSKVLFDSSIAAIQEGLIGSYFPSKPTVVQFPINDICNSRCGMCDIWKRKRDKEITPEELRLILTDPLFSAVRYVGISGGEPTLRADLPEIGKALVEGLPLLRGLGIITNAIQPQKTVDRLNQLAAVAKGSGLVLNTMVSLDGVGSDHDRNRGVKGNFESAIEVINKLRANGLKVGIGCTLTPENCYGADDLLIWCEESAIEFWEFRLGIEIKRVYNDGYSARHPFSLEDRFHLIQFFEKLSFHPRVGPTQRHFYRSLVAQMAFGAGRVAGCDWRSRGVTLDSRGNISYCSVESPILGCALETSAWSIYRRNIRVRHKIIRTKCNSCEHDLVGPLPFKVALKEFSGFVGKPILRRLAKMSGPRKGAVLPTTIRSPLLERPSSWHHVLITGWYGTETAGDKAILGEIVSFIRFRSPKCRISITTLDAKVSQQTNREIPELSDLTLVDLSDAAKPAVIDSCDAILFGGGPLEEIPASESILNIFIEANRRQKARVIFGCGVGPLYSDHLRNVVGGILRLATAGFFRDQESWEFARKLGASENLGFACDPAIAHIVRWRNVQAITAKEQENLRLIALLRANTNEYVNDLSSAELQTSNERAAIQFAGVLNAFAVSSKATVSLLPMHCLREGGDDRLFNRSIRDAFPDRSVISLERRYLSLSTLLTSIQTGHLAMAMRYHGHIFCMALGLPFLSIDYTGENGKVASLVRRIGFERFKVDWRKLEHDKPVARLRELATERRYWSQYLRERADELAEELTELYQKQFPE